MRRLATLTILLSASACQPKLPAYTAHVPPRWVDVRPQASVVFVAGDIELRALINALGAIPMTFEQSGATSHAQASYHFERRTTIVRPVAEGLEILVSVGGLVTIGVGPLECHGEQINIELSARSRPTLAGNELVLFDNPQLHLQVSGEMNCLGVKVPIGSIVSPLVNALTHGLERALAMVRVPIDPLLRGALAMIAQPRAITVAGSAACLDLAPTSFVIEPFDADRGRLTIKLGVVVAPRLNLGACPVTTRVIPDRVMTQVGLLGDDFAVDVDVAITHDELNLRLSQELIGKRFASHGQSIEVRSVELADANGRVLVRLGVSGAFDGNLYLWGTPALVQRDDHHWFVDVPDLQVALETRNAVQRLKLAFWQMLDGGLPHAVRDKLTIDVTDRINETVAAVQHTWTRDLADGVALNVALNEIMPHEAISRPGVIALRATLRGHASLYFR